MRIKLFFPSCFLAAIKKLSFFSLLSLAAATHCTSCLHASESRILRRLRSDLTRSLLILKNELGATQNVSRTGFQVPANSIRGGRVQEEGAHRHHCPLQQGQGHEAEEEDLLAAAHQAHDQQHGEAHTLCHRRQVIIFSPSRCPVLTH